MSKICSIFYGEPQSPYQLPLAASAKNKTPPPASRSNSKKAATAKEPPPPGGNRKKTHQQQKASLTKWIGCRKFHDLRPQRNRHDHPVHEGSKVVGFTRSSPSRVWKLQLKSKRFSHLVLLSRTLGPSNIFFLRLSVTHSCKHLFVCPCVEAILPDEGRV